MGNDPSGLIFDAVDGTGMVVNGKSLEGDLQLPDGIRNRETGSIHPLRVIRQEAFSNSKLQTIYISKSIETIEYASFAYCHSLSTVNFAVDSELKRIEGHAFSYCPLHSIALPPGVESLGEFCFAHCRSLKSVAIQSASQIRGVAWSAFHGSPVSPTLPEDARPPNSQAP
jgi:hypothetical protein